MNKFLLEGLRTLFGKSGSVRAIQSSGQGDVYVTRLVAGMNYCKNHPNSAKCENLFLQS